MARFFRTGITADGDISTTGFLKSTNSVGDEGGQIDLAKAITNTTLTTGVTIDVFRNQLRIFETGNTNRGYYIDITSGAASVGTSLVGGGSASNSFSTISVPSGTNPIASSTTDTLTFTAGTGISITGTASTDTISIATNATDINTASTIVSRDASGAFSAGIISGTSFNSITGLSSTTPSASGTAAVGTATTAARADHVHPTTGLGLTGTGLGQFASTTSAQLAIVISDDTGSGALVFGTTPTITPADAVATTSATTAGFMGMPQNAKTASYTLVASDAGKHIYFSGTTASQTITIPANGSVGYQIGTTITFINLATVSVSIAITTDTMYLAGPGTTGTRTLAAYGMATAVKITSTSWIISGNGLT